MDVDLLAKMIGDLVLEHKEVGLPGLGTFVSETVPASFSDRGYIINPPYRRLTFHPGRSEEDLLAAAYAESNGLDEQTARAILTKFLTELKEVLKSTKTVVFPGLGRLRATKENNFFFVCDENLDIYPEGYGLEPVSLKTHSGAEVSRFEKEVSALASIVTVPEPAPAPAPAEKTAPAEEAAPVEEPAGEVEPLPEPEAVPAEEPAPAEETSPADEPVPAEEPVEIALEAEDAPPALPEEEFVVEPADEPEEEPAPAEEPAPKKRKSRFWQILGITQLVLIIVSAVAMAAFLILARVAPEFIDSLLYTPEELRILNY